MIRYIARFNVSLLIKEIICVGVCILYGCIFNKRLHADTYYAISCAQEHVEAMIDSAEDGDTVMVPAGTATWLSTVIINESIALIGSGADFTKITYGRDSPMIDVSLSEDKPVRITGFYFDLLDNNHPGGSGRHAIKISGDNSGAFGQTQIRIDHNTFNKGTRQIYWTGWAYGLIDHNYFINGNISVGLNGDNNHAWDRPIAPGTADAVFIEDNTFTINNDTDREPNHLIYHQEGARTVTRYNIFDGSTYTNGYSIFYDTHGNQNYYTGGNDFRGQPMIEIYNNTFHAYKKYSPMVGNLRGGSMFVYDNTLICETSSPSAFSLTEEESWQTLFFDPLVTEWPAEDQINNSFFWNNTLNGQSVTNVALSNAADSIFIQKDRDYWMHEPASTGGRTVYSGRQGGDMIFIATGPNAYYPYTPFAYPHPLSTNDTTYEIIVNVYPNPCRVYEGENSVTFSGDLSAGDNIKVFDMSGKLVHNSGDFLETTYEWGVGDITSGIYPRPSVRSGVYLYVVKSSDGQKKTSGKIVVIR